MSRSPRKGSPQKRVQSGSGVGDARPPSTSAPVDPTARRQRSTSSDSSVMRSCDTCLKGNKLAREDPHSTCLKCLGRNHDMKACADCTAMTVRARLQRARSMLLWRHGLTTRPLSRRQYNDHKEEFATSKYVQTAYLMHFLGLREEDVRGEDLGDVAPPRRKDADPMLVSTAKPAVYGPLPSPNRSQSPLAGDTPLEIDESDLLNLSCEALEMPELFSGLPIYKWRKGGTSDVVFQGTQGQFESWKAGSQTDSGRERPDRRGDVSTPIVINGDPPRKPPSAALGSQASDSQNVSLSTVSEMIMQSQEAFKQQLLEQQRIQQQSQNEQFEAFMSTIRASAQPSSTRSAAPNVSLATGHLGSQSTVVPRSEPTIPEVSPIDKAKAWTAAMPTTTQDPITLFSDDESVSDSLQSGLMVEPQSVRRTPAMTLGEGQCPYDWDAAGLKFPFKDEIPANSRSHQRLECNAQWLGYVAKVNEVPPEIREVRQPDPFSLSTEPSIPVQQPLALSNTTKDAWTESREHRSMRSQNLLPPSVRKGYRLTRDDWAFLGAVRRPDDMLTHLTKSTKVSAKGVHSLTGHKNLISLASYLQENIQFTAHTMRPLAHAISASFCLKQFSEEIQKAVAKGDAAKILETSQRLLGIGTFIWSALEDTSECLARGNADAVRKLRDLWLEHATLPHEVREGIRQLPVVRGNIPAERNAEFAAPLVGDDINKLYDQAYKRAKASQALYKRQAQFKPATIKRKGDGQNSGNAKKPRNDNAKKPGPQKGQFQPKYQGGQRQYNNRGRGGKNQGPPRGGTPNAKGKQGDKQSS